MYTLSPAPMVMYLSGLHFPICPLEGELFRHKGFEGSLPHQSLQNLAQRLAHSWADGKWLLKWTHQSLSLPPPPNDQELDKCKEGPCWGYNVLKINVSPTFQLASFCFTLPQINCISATRAKNKNPVEQSGTAAVKLKCFLFFHFFWFSKRISKFYSSFWCA